MIRFCRNDDPTWHFYNGEKCLTFGSEVALKDWISEVTLCEWNWIKVKDNTVIYGEDVIGNIEVFD